MRTMKNSLSAMGWALHFAAAASLIWIPLALALTSSGQASAQESAQESDRPVTASAPVVPQQVRYAGKLAARAGETVEAEFRIYAVQQGGEPLWTETQQLPVGLDGSYSVLLGAASPAGLPQAVFAGGAARWLGISVDRSAEQERVLLSSVPYAMKSADAESLSGHAASEFVTQDQLAALAATGSAPAAGPVQPNTSGPITGSGTVNNLALFTGANAIGNANMVQSGTSIGINVGAPASTLDVGGGATVRGTFVLPALGTATTTNGFGSNVLKLGASSYSSTIPGPVAQNFALLTVPTGNNTAGPSASLELLFGSGTGGLNATGFSIANTGRITFAAGQAFPGTGAITSIAATSPLTGGGASGAVTLGLNNAALETTLNAVYPQLASANAFHGNQTINGGLTVTSALNAASATLTGNLNVAQIWSSSTINTRTPFTATATSAPSSPQYWFGASAYNSSTSAAVSQNLGWQAVVTGNNTATPSANLVLLSSTGTNPLVPTGMSISAKGLVNWAPGQTFPGTGAGTITGITTTSPLTGSGTTGSVALGLNETTLTSDITPSLETTFNTIYPQLATNNVFGLGASFGGPISASASGSGLNAVTATGTTGAYGVNASSDTGNAGSFGNASAPDATVFSENTASFNGSYIPVALNATATGTDSIGAFGGGTLAGVTGSSSTGIGLWGVSGSISSIPTLTTTGILGDAQAPAFGNAGVLAYTGSSQSTSYTYEVGRNGIAGVWGDTTGNPASVDDFSAAVMGTTDAYDGYGGAFIANSAITDALFAKNLNSGNGIYAESLGVGVSSGGQGTGGTGVEGFTPSPAEGQAGVLGEAYQFSNTYSTVKALGPVGFVAGVWGDSGEVNDGTLTYTAAVVGTGDDITAAVFENNSPSGHPTVSALNLYNGASGVLFRSLIAATPDGVCGFGGAGNMTCTGQVKALATTEDARKLETYSVQSPENWMEDFGTGELKLGVAMVKIDPAFAETVSPDASYHVFITPNGDAEALYVINKTATGFEVRESKGGTSSLTFDYRIVAKRRGYEAQRLTDVTERFNAEQARAMPPKDAAAAHNPSPQRPAVGNPGKFGTPGADATPGAQGTPRALPRTPAVALKVGAGRLESLNHH